MLSEAYMEPKIAGNKVEQDIKLSCNPRELLSLAPIVGKTLV